VVQTTKLDGSLLQLIGGSMITTKFSIHQNRWIKTPKLVVFHTKTAATTIMLKLFYVIFATTQRYFHQNLVKNYTNFTIKPPIIGGYLHRLNYRFTNLWW